MSYLKLEIEIAISCFLDLTFLMVSLCCSKLHPFQENMWFLPGVAVQEKLLPLMVRGVSGNRALESLFFFLDNQGSSAPGMDPQVQNHSHVMISLEDVFYLTNSN